MLTAIIILRLKGVRVIQVFVIYALFVTLLKRRPFEFPVAIYSTSFSHNCQTFNVFTPLYP